MFALKLAEKVAIANIFTVTVKAASVDMKGTAVSVTEGYCQESFNLISIVACGSENDGKCKDV